jgi:integrase/recombinase XerD
MGVKRKIKKSDGYDLIPLLQAWDEYITEKEARNLSAATIKSYEETFVQFINFFEFDDDTTTDEINQQMMFKWMHSLKLSGIKHTSINHYLRDMRAFLYWCMNEDRQYIAPAFKIQLMVGQEEPLKLFTDDDLDALLVKPRKNDGFTEWRTWAIVNWVLGTGNRASSICNVKLSDVNYKKKEISINVTKNNKPQIIPLSSSLEIVLKEYVRMWRKDADVDGYLFCNVGEEKLTTNALRQAFGRYCKDRGVDRTNIHGLRHNFAKGWVQSNGNMFALQKILGHSSLDMTRKYVKIFSEDLKEDFDKFNPLDNIKRSQKRTHIVRRAR